MSRLSSGIEINSTPEEGKNENWRVSKGYGEEGGGVSNVDAVNGLPSASPKPLSNGIVASVSIVPETS